MPSQRFKFLFLILISLSVSSQIFICGQSSRRGGRAKPASTTTSKNSSPESEPSAQSTTPYVSQEGRFRIKLPQGFNSLEKSGEQSAVTPNGELIKVVTLEKKVKAGRGYSQCIIAYINYPERIFSEMSPDQIFSTAQQGTLRSLPTPVTLREEKFNWFSESGAHLPIDSYMDMDFYSRLNFSEAPGLTTLISTRDADGMHYMRFDLLLIKPRLYSMALVYQNRAKFEDAEVKNFFDSFHLIKAE